MKAAPFAWQRPASLNEALGALAPGQASAIGGGQSLGPMLNLRLARPAALIELRRLPELRASGVDQGVLRLGAAVTHAEIEDGLVPDTTHGMLPWVARGIAYRAIRNRGTIGGSLCHADPAADWVNSLMVLGAKVELASTAGRRQVPVEDFMRGAYATDLQPGEVLAAVELPAFGPGMRWGWNKICAKVGEFADAIGAVVLDPALGHCRLLVGAVEARPVLLPEPQALLRAVSEAAGAPAAPQASAAQGGSGSAIARAPDVPAAVELLAEAVGRAFPAHDAVFVHQHAVALARAIAQFNARGARQP
jgi:carbon-monoxide dehydrogenase medium subunit